MGKRVTIYTIAQKLQISPSAVSMALRDSSEIGAKTRARVKATAAELGYEPHLMARSLRTRRTGALGVILLNIHDPFQTTVADAIDQSLRPQGYQMLIALESDGAVAGRLAVELIKQGRVDGIVMNYQGAELHEAALRQLGRPFPPVVVRCDTRERAEGLFVDTVLYDLYQPVYALISHLASLGHRRIGYLHPVQPSFGVSRLEGYRRACADLGLALDEELTVFTPMRPDAGRIGARRLLELQPRPTAILCSGDFMAFEALRATSELGLRVPDDISVAGIGNVPVAPYLAVHLTTIDCFPTRLGEETARLLLRRIADPGAVRMVVEVPPQLVVGATCSRPCSSQGDAL